MNYTDIKNRLDEFELNSTELIIERVKLFLSDMETIYINKLNTEDIVLNDHGTITIEWRKNGNIISVEIGNTTANYYAIIGEEKFKSESDNMELIFSINLKIIFKSMYNTKKIRNNRCAACAMISYGVKSRKTLPHTCTIKNKIY